MPRSFKPPAPEFIHARWHGGGQTPTLIVKHATVGSTKKGAARGVAHFFQTESTPTSAHYTVDEAEEIQCVGDHRVAYHCGYNQDSIGVEMCFMPLLHSLANWLLPKKLRPSKPRQHKGYWLAALQPSVRRMLTRAADLDARLALAYDIPIRYLGVKGVLAWDRAGRPAHMGGITTHAVMTKAFKESTHWDPGAWPRRLFMRRVRKAAEKIRGGGHQHHDPAPAPTPEPTPTPAPALDVTVGTHNLRDGAAEPTFFADVVVFTEALLGPARAAAAKADYDLWQQHNRTVLTCVRQGLLSDVTTEWHTAHGGRAKVSPARGTLVVRGTWADGTLVGILGGHRVNNSYPPFKHGEGPWRAARYADHAALDAQLIAELEGEGRIVFAAGDMNVKPHSDMTAWDGALVEAGTALDRVGASKSMRLAKVHYMHKIGSDHPRLRAEFTTTEETQ